MFRRLPEVQRGFSECRVREAKRQEGRSAGKSAGRKEANGWQWSLAGCRSRT